MDVWSISWGVHLQYVYGHALICEVIGCNGMCIQLYVKLLGVMVFLGSMLNWGAIYHGYMCILLYVKLIGCNNFA